MEIFQMGSFSKLWNRWGTFHISYGGHMGVIWGSYGGHMRIMLSLMEVLYWDSRSSEKMAAKFMKRDTFIQMVIFKQIFHFCIFRWNFNSHTSPTSMPNFCIGFWNDIGDKKSEKNHFQVLPIFCEKYPCRPVFEGFELNRKTSPPFLNE